MAVLKGDLASITAQLEQWRDVSQEPPVWLDIEITTDEHSPVMIFSAKIRALTESLPVVKYCWYVGVVNSASVC